MDLRDGSRPAGARTWVVFKGSHPEPLQVEHQFCTSKKHVEILYALDLSDAFS